MKGDALKGHLELLLLATLRARPAHGYAIIEELKRRSGGAFELPEGTIYPALHRLERGGAIESAWSDESGRRRRVYRLTRKGERALAEQTSAWEGFSTAMTRALQGAT